jgi:hypothetical protein
MGVAGVLVGAQVDALNGNGDGEFENGEVADTGWKGEGVWCKGEDSDWKEVIIWCCGMVRVIGDLGSMPGNWCDARRIVDIFEV